MKAGYERAAIVTELLYQARLALGAAVCAAETFPDAPPGIDGLYSLCDSYYDKWNKFMRNVPDDEGDSINSLVLDVEAENEARKNE